jgi:hypothetical protein
LRTVSKGLVMFAGLLAAPVADQAHRAAPASEPQPDPRLVRLHQFLGEQECPVKRFARDFIEAADNQDLDWRLLPSISFVESGGGKEYKNNNVFGWANCRERFPSIRAGIHFVAERLAHSKLYKHKGVDQILRTYNPNEGYLQRVKAVMERLGSADMGESGALN